MNIIFMGTPDFAVPTLESLYNKGYNIALVITQRDKPKGRGKKFQPTAVKEKALELELEVYQPDNVNSAESIEKMKKLNPDFIVVAAYGQILRKQILDMPKYGCINVHASLLPKYRGAAPINWAIINGEKETGITIMEMAEGLDTGDMILSKEIPINEEDDFQIVHDKLALLGSELIVEALEGIKDNRVIKVPQDNKLSTYASMISKEIGRINWGKDGENIKNLVRGLKPRPSAYTVYNGNIVKIHKVKLVDKFKEGKDGEIVLVTDEGIFVNALDKCVVIEEIQFPGKKKLLVKDYLRGNRIEEGVILI
ncbi:methionyl-tRNA formyltransferase [Tissierella sp. MSJ-40]|uniref:Methionyl-tRNA formyltransferase n=1 Tax=Tissierella simiarum TaxID=2841534 RepID=A0ABS6E4S8_9FIRM|nr:methionyl-tRNA formyltransferase [Tissierella simiarum]MBU5437764.1 methionyl-tRNA formyltransferase [Tissierella simiarum]